jgi:hypothetical protein
MLGVRTTTGRTSELKRAIVATVQGVPPTPVVSVDPEPPVELRQETIYPVLEAIALAGGVELAVATLPAPPTGKVHIIERLLVWNTPNVDKVWVAVGQQLTTPGLRDIAAFPTEDALVTADAAPIVVLEQQPLKIVWFTADTAGYFANVQYRVEDL